jgi:multiple sugar transport system permease protein
MTVLVSSGEILFGVFAAYAFARLEFPGRDRLFLLLLTSLMVPPIVVMLPLYIILDHIGWVNTLEGLVVPQMFSFGTAALVVFFLRQYFATLPRELEEAAYIDGAGPLRTLWRIVLPNAFPALGTVASLAIVAAWNNLLWPLLIINTNSKYVLTIGLASLVGEFNDANWGAIMGGTALLLLPLLLAFVAGHRYFLNSVAVSGLK